MIITWLERDIKLMIGVTQRANSVMLRKYMCCHPLSIRIRTHRIRMLFKTNHHTLPGQWKGGPFFQSLVPSYEEEKRRSLVFFFIFNAWSTKSFVYLVFLSVFKDNSAPRLMVLTRHVINHYFKYDSFFWTAVSLLVEHWESYIYIYKIGYIFNILEVNVHEQKHWYICKICWYRFNKNFGRRNNSCQWYISRSSKISYALAKFEPI